MVGEWTGSTSRVQNAVAAGFDRFGRIFYRTINLDISMNIDIVAPTATAIWFEDIDLRSP